MKYPTNPAVDKLAARNPLVHALASKERPAPRMFGDRDLPLMTASGVDPSVLAEMPPGVRHAAAAMTDRADVYRLVEQTRGNPDARVHHPDLIDYEKGVTAWASGRHGDGQPTAPSSAEDSDALAALMFGKDGEKLRSRPPITETMERRVEQGRMVWRPKGEA